MTFDIIILVTVSVVALSLFLYAGYVEKRLAALGEISSSIRFLVLYNSLFLESKYEDYVDPKGDTE